MRNDVALYLWVSPSRITLKLVLSFHKQYANKRIGAIAREVYNTCMRVE